MVEQGLLSQPRGGGAWLGLGEAEKLGEEEIRRLAEARAFFEKRARDLEQELEGLKLILELIDNALASASFKRATEVVKPAEEAPPTEYKRVIPLRAADGTLLANMYIGEDFVQVIPAQGVKLYTSTPPFQSFLVGRIFEAMQEKDREDAQRGKIPPDQIFSYKIVQDGDELKSVIIRNYREERRLRELRTAIKWTFEKMREKIA